MTTPSNMSDDSANIQVTLDPVQGVVASWLRAQGHDPDEIERDGIAPSDASGGGSTAGIGRTKVLVTNSQTVLAEIGARPPRLGLGAQFVAHSRAAQGGSSAQRNARLESQLRRKIVGQGQAGHKKRKRKRGKGGAELLESDEDDDEDEEEEQEEEGAELLAAKAAKAAEAADDKSNKKKKKKGKMWGAMMAEVMEKAEAEQAALEAKRAKAREKRRRQRQRKKQRMKEQKGEQQQ